MSLPRRIFEAGEAAGIFASNLRNERTGDYITGRVG